MTASLSLSLAWLLLASVLGCGAPAHDERDQPLADTTSMSALASALVSAHGEFLADGSCRASVGGTPLFAPAGAARVTYDAGAVADIAPAGYALHQLACAPPGADPALPHDRGDERMVLVTLYVREGSSLRPGRYVVRPGLAEAGDSAGIAARAGIAIFGSRAASSGGASRAGVRYLEGREGTLDIVSVDGVHVVGRFDVHAGAAWSM